ncbi:MAG: LacI family DNA-binding transcriptional regulator [Agathobacter sp.]|nr:LacI family DNA-binding transcriptional regulator [Agathobacter sp.]
MTIKDIAKESGYAVGTVSRVLNDQPGVSEKARVRIMEVVDKYQFRLNSNAKLLKQQNNNSVAVIIKGTNNMLFAGLVEILQGLIKDKSYTSVVYYINEDGNEVEQAMQICRDIKPLGILFLGSNKENFRDKFEYVDVPCVLVTNSAEGLDFENLSSVCINDEKAAKTAIEYLITLGHKKIGVLGGEMKYSTPAKARYEGCLSAFVENGIDFDPDKYYESNYFTMDGGYHAMKCLLQKTTDLTAVFAMSDVTAIGAIRAICESGKRVPEDISVIGFDGIEIGQYIAPRLTTIRQPDERIAERVVDILLKQISGEGTAIHEQTTFTLVEGNSTCRLMY